MSENIEQLKAELHAFKKNNEELIQRHNAAIASWDEERERALREGNRVLEWQGKYEQLERENAALNETTQKHVTAYYELMAENAALRNALFDADVIAEHSRDDGEREWWSGGYWLHRNEVLVCMDRAAIDAARKEAQP